MADESGSTADDFFTVSLGPFTSLAEAERVSGEARIHAVSEFEGHALAKFAVWTELTVTSTPAGGPEFRASLIVSGWYAGKDGADPDDPARPG